MARDPAFQYHFSTEPDLEPGVAFAYQTRTCSSAGARGEACGEGIYSTTNPGYWFTQLARENVAELPRHVYLVRVAEPGLGTVWAAHQDLSQPADIVVLAKLMVVPDDDTPLDVGRLEWAVDRWLEANPDVVQEVAARSNFDRPMFF